WRNDNFIQLEAPASTDSFSNSIFISNGDVYICGFIDYITGAGYDKRACYWKNGELTILSLSISDAKKIYVLDNDVYIFGYIGTGCIDERPCYWKNDNLEYLPVPSGTTFATAFSLYYDSVDLYICGFYDNGNQHSCYWKNGERTDINISATDSRAYGININGSDIHVYYILGTSLHTLENACHPYRI
ncbi:MAG: hypothetical protein OQK82_02510, partial [Candidatus Pacearchaeota archaeon]|nr:hypothetical protein [Candidatus Pacearchaeota archaeon]